MMALVIVSSVVVVLVGAVGVVALTVRAFLEADR